MMGVKKWRPWCENFRGGELVWSKKAKACEKKRKKRGGRVKKWVCACEKSAVEEKKCGVGAKKGAM